MLASSKHMSFLLKPAAPPFRLNLTAWALRRRSNNIVDRWENGTWCRAMVLDGLPAEVCVAQSLPNSDAPLQVTLSGTHVDASMKQSASLAVKRCLGIDKNLTDFYRVAEKDQRLNELAGRFMGLKPPRFPSVFEAAVNGIACQQVSLNLGIILLNRLASDYGPRVSIENGMIYAFPRPKDLAGLQPEDLRKLGFSCNKGKAIIDLAQAIISGAVDLERLQELSNEASEERLCGLRGFGRWTAQYVLLRGLGRLDIFPADDVGGRRGLQRWLKKQNPLDYDAASRIVKKWNPYGGFIYFHLLLNRIEDEGLFKQDAKMN